MLSLCHSAAAGSAELRDGRWLYIAVLLVYSYAVPSNSTALRAIYRSGILLEMHAAQPLVSQASIEEMTASYG